MPRGPRLDAPGALHHVRARGIERGRIFYDDKDREDLLERLARIVREGALEVYAWALMPNHVHLLVRTRDWPLERSMRALLAGYATWFNRRHERAGHLFQNRYKSTLCQEELYFRKLVQYIHLNPVPSVIPDLDALASYPYTGHSVLLGRSSRPWQDTGTVLGLFADEVDRAKLLYEDFVRSGSGEERPDLEGGGLVRSLGGWQHVHELRRGRERFTSDERILGDSRFVEGTLAELEGGRFRDISADEVIDRVCRALRLEPAVFGGNGRLPKVSRARQGIAYLWIARLGRSGRQIAERLGVKPASAYEAARRGRAEAPYWSSLLEDPTKEPDEP